MTRWQYNTVIFDIGFFSSGKIDGEKFQERLDALGQEGWELVSVFDTNVYEGRTGQVIAVFKRPA